MDNIDFLQFTAEVGFPIASACASGGFVFLTLKFILEGVTSSLKGLKGTIVSLNNRIDAMVNELQRVDVRISGVLDIDPDFDRIARASQSDHRKD